MQPHPQTTETDVIDQLVARLVDKKSIKKPLFGKSPTNNQKSEYEQRIDNTAKLLINQIKQIEQKLYSLSLELKNAKEQLNALLNKHNLKENAKQIENHIKLMSYIHSSLSQGTPPEIIKQELISQGWPKEMVDRLFSAILPNL